MTEISRLSNGITVVMETMPYLKSAAFGVWVRAGSANEEADNNGVAHMIEHMMFKGTTSRSARQIADETARIGGNINAFTSKECTSYYATVLSEHLDKAIDIISDMLINSVIDEKDLKKEKGVIIEEIDMYEDSPEDLSHELLQQRIWKDHPLGYYISGTKKTVRRATRDQIVSFMDNYYTGNNIIISVAGNFNPAETLGFIEDKFGAIMDKSQNAANAPAKPGYHKVFCRKEKDIEQLHMNMAFDCISYLSQERYVLSVFNSILGGSINSRLFQKIRESSGLTYSIYSYGSSYKDTGLLHIYAAMNPSQYHTVMMKILKIVNELRKKGITKEELAMAKEQIKTDLILGSESVKNRMNANGKSMLHRGRIVTLEELIEEIDNVSLENVKYFAERYLDVENSSLSLVGNIKEHNLKAVI